MSNMALTIDSTINFGKVHYGHLVKDVVEINPQYILYCGARFDDNCRSLAQKRIDHVENSNKKYEDSTLIDALPSNNDIYLSEENSTDNISRIKNYYSTTLEFEVSKGVVNTTIFVNINSISHTEIDEKRRTVKLIMNNGTEHQLTMNSEQFKNTYLDIMPF